MTRLQQLLRLSTTHHAGNERIRGRKLVHSIPCLLAGFFILFSAAGCQSPAPRSPNAVIVVTGVQGHGSEYTTLSRSISASDSRDVRVFSWGAPKPLFFLNFSTRAIHERAEQKLATLITEHRQRFPHGRLDLVGHSAGCGVILGALARLPHAHEVTNVVLIAPSVSPDYEISPSLHRVQNRVHVFVSDRDTLFLKWRTGNFGTYDRVKTAAAGNVGFNLERIEPAVRTKLQQHRYDERWRELGHDGGHFGALARGFAAGVISPLLADDEYVLRP